MNKKNADLTYAVSVEPLFGLQALQRSDFCSLCVVPNPRQTGLGWYWSSWLGG